MKARQHDLLPVGRFGRYRQSGAGSHHPGRLHLRAERVDRRLYQGRCREIGARSRPSSIFASGFAARF